MKKIGLAFCVVVGSFGAAGCDTSSSGAEGVLFFTPTECGRVGCNFNDSVGVGGALLVHISPRDSTVSTVGLDLESSDESIFTIQAVPDVGGEPTWEIIGQNDGVTSLTAFDTATGDDVDFIAVVVQELDALSSRNVLGDAVGPDLNDQDFDEVWTINADQRVSFSIDPIVGNTIAMGRYEYTATIDAAIDDGLVDSDSLSDGHLDFSVPVGEHAASFVDNYGHTIDLLFVAQ